MERITINGIEYDLMPRVKSELDVLKEKYGSGEYICITYEKGKWHILSTIGWSNSYEYKLIHKKHESVLNSYLADNSVDYDTNNPFDTGVFIDTYIEDYDYRLKPKQEYPVFKRNEDGEVFRQDSKADCQWVLCKNTDAIGNEFRQYTGYNLETIPHEEKTGLYHLQPVWCWDDTDRHMRQIRFYSKENRVIHHSNSNKDLNWDNIEPVTPEQLQVMPFIFEMYQKLLNESKN